MISRFLLLFFSSDRNRVSRRREEGGEKREEEEEERRGKEGERRGIVQLEAANVGRKRVGRGEGARGEL